MAARRHLSNSSMLGAKILVKFLRGFHAPLAMLGLEMGMALEMGEKGEGEVLDVAGADEAFDRMPKSDLALLVTARMRLSRRSVRKKSLSLVRI
ncbi:hypothetical protein Nepgr_029406 [Nepenthes gracilis]|uniref:Uncharacterized protein n=1 Tax=Nepenthes gracilis TaxID=150966 RepID=A0AAD3TE57_NEPGR|nr:hypothetical protein Nepgr_029406 [Nepenthes gracilis]